MIPSFSASANGSAFHLQLCRLLHRIKAPQIQWRDRSGLIPASFFDHVSTWAQNRLLSYLNYIISKDFVKRCNDKYSHPFLSCLLYFFTLAMHIYPYCQLNAPTYEFSQSLSPGFCPVFPAHIPVLPQHDP